MKADIEHVENALFSLHIHEKRDIEWLRMVIEKAEGQPWDIVVKRWYKKRTLSQNALFHVVVDKLAWAIGMDASVVKEGIKDNVRSPKVVYRNKPVSKPTHLCNSQEMAEYIEIAIQEAAEHGVDVFEEYVGYQAWKEKEGVEPHYRDTADYKARHKFCEACGRWLMMDGVDKQVYIGELSHIRSRGAGGRDTAQNLLVLCYTCHRQVQHQQGWDDFKLSFKHLAHKINKALKGVRE